MKNIYKLMAIMLLLLFAIDVCGQENKLSYKQESDLLIENIDKTQIPTGILYDRVFPLAHLETFTGLSTADTSGIDHLYQAYFEITNAAFDTSAFLTLPALGNLVTTTLENSEANYEIAFLYYDFNTL